MDHNMKKSTPSHQPGDGIRTMDSTSVFRVANFELYVKPNKFVMGLGLVAITGCFTYIGYMNWLTTKGLDHNYIAVTEDGTKYICPRISKWE
ncbi:small integral membrane protein 8 [Tachypleus tridentatus]|uniref:small integral membrane protein 8 n=1 Tax=Tachypleus tridentatus TaxID=6853 RepID=UPI003FD1A390